MRVSESEQVKQNPASGASSLDTTRSWLAAGLVFILMTTAAIVPAWQSKLQTGYHQVRLLPQRIDTPLEELRRQTVGEEYTFLASVSSRTFEDALILVSEDPRDGRFSSTLWLAYFLYPRILVQSSGLAPETAVDFVMTTPHFDPSIPPGSISESSGYGLLAVSERAREWGRTRWKP